MQPASMLDVGLPVNLQKVGFYNAYIVPAELGWKLGNSGFAVKIGLGMYVPDGTVSGPNSIGAPWWTFQPKIFLSYLKDGWSLTAFVSAELNTKNTITNFRSGHVLETEFTATKTIGKWTVGPVGYYVGQITDDTSSAFSRNAINTNRFDIYAAGALVGYNFGPTCLGRRRVLHEGVRRRPARIPVDMASITSGWKVFANLSVRIWSSDEPTAPKKMLSYK